MVNIKTLLPELKALVTALAEDLLSRVTEDTELDGRLRDGLPANQEGWSHRTGRTRNGGKTTSIRSP